MAEQRRAFWDLPPAQIARPTWRCYFCDEVFTTPGGAADHFGATLLDKPGCLIDYQVQVEAGVTTQRGRGLLMALRKAQLELDAYRQEDTELHRHIHRLQSEHQQALQREEEKGYRRGLIDAHRYPADAAVAAGVREAVIVQCPGCGEGVADGMACRRKRGATRPPDCKAGPAREGDPDAYGVTAVDETAGQSIADGVPERFKGDALNRLAVPTRGNTVGYVRSNRTAVTPKPADSGATRSDAPGVPPSVGGQQR